MNIIQLQQENFLLRMYNRNLCNELLAIKRFLSDDNWGKASYMESIEIYDDINRRIDSITDAIKKNGL